jgi:acyl dehydratase
VRPGDTLHVEFEITDTRLSRSKPDRGIVGVKYRTLNQRGEEVLTLRSTQLIGRKPG